MIWLKYVTPRNALICGLVLFYLVSSRYWYSSGYDKCQSEKQEETIAEQQAVITKTSEAIDVKAEKDKAIIAHKTDIERAVGEAASDIANIESVPVHLPDMCCNTDYRMLRAEVYRSFPRSLFVYESDPVPSSNPGTTPEDGMPNTPRTGEN
jgi:hypothetical protein